MVQSRPWASQVAYKNRKESANIGDHLFITCPKFSEKQTFLSPCVRIRGQEILVLQKIFRTYLMHDSLPEITELFKMIITMLTIKLVLFNNTQQC